MTTQTPTHKAVTVPSTKIINRKQLLAMVPLSERTILDMEKRGEFPRRFAITPRLVAWDLAEVEAWIKKRKEAAMQPASPWPLPA